MIHPPNPMAINTNYLFERILAAEEKLEPFPHCIIENAFHPDDYIKILEFNPFRLTDGVEWITQGHNYASKTPYHLRWQINFPGMLTDLQSLDIEVHKFWNSIYEGLIANDQLLKILISKFERYFSYRFGPLCKESKFLALVKSEAFLQRHRPGYFLGPHTDIPIRIATIIFSFAYDSNYPEFGTRFYKFKGNDLVKCSGKRHHVFEDFEEVGCSPYLPNNVFIFLKTSHSFHGVCPIEQEIPGDRYGMQIQFYEPHDEILRDLSMPLKEPTFHLKDHNENL